MGGCRSERSILTNDVRNHAVQVLGPKAAISEGQDLKTTKNGVRNFYLRLELQLSHENRAKVVAYSKCDDDGVLDRLLLHNEICIHCLSNNPKLLGSENHRKAWFPEFFSKVNKGLAISGLSEKQNPLQPPLETIQSWGILHWTSL